VAVEDAVAGTILTDWHMVERLTEDEVSHANPGMNAGVGPGQLPAIGGKFFRLKVEIKPGGPPWRVVVDGEAALYTPGMALIQPYDHGDADEPAWVKTRIEKVRVAIHRKLGKYAKVSAEPVKVAGELSTAPWDGLPEGAPMALARIHAAAKKKDVGALRKHMVDTFVWSSGGDPSADTAVSLWSADPLVLSALVQVLEGGCAERDAATVVCPRRAQPGSTWRAELTRQGKDWRLSAFFQE
jgi:hypothetical protein